jgi:arylsulfatase A-like enzyme
MTPSGSSHRPATTGRPGVAPAAGLALLLLLSGCPGPKKAVVYDLAARLPFAEHWSSRLVVLFGTPASEPNQASGFYREAGAPKGDRFAWARREAEVSLTLHDVSPRAAIVELAPYAGTRNQSAEVFLNGVHVAQFGLNDLRHPYRVPLPEADQRAGDNRLRFVFAADASPAESDPKNGDERRLAAAFYSLTVGAADDAGLDDLLRPDAAVPFSVPESGVPSLTMVGPAVARYAIRLPEGAELRFSPDLLASARAAAGAASFRVTLEAEAGKETTLWSRVISAKDTAPRELALAIPGEAGAIVRLGLHVGSVSGDRFAWGRWGAPRVVGSGEGWREPGAPPRDERQRGEALRKALGGANVLFVILDAGRAREFGCYGYTRATTPEIDRIAREGVVFDHAYTPAVYTLGAMSSVWTSQYPDRHHSEVSFSARLPKDRLTLAELLSAHGIATAGFVANGVAGSLFGFDRGFETFREIYKDLGSDADGFRKVVPPWLDANGARRFFAYVHFREPHFPYDPPPPFDTRFGPDGPIPKAIRRDIGWINDLNQGRRAPKPGEIEHLARLFDGNLAFADHEIGALRRALEERGLWDKTLVVIAADHGEGLFEHRWIGHNVHVYDEAMHVPLIVRFPKGAGPQGTRVASFVDLLDVAPTVADVFGVLGQGGSDTQFQGESLLDVIGGSPGKSAVLSRTVWDRPRYGVRDDRFKLIYDTRTGAEELYDLRSDPGETANVAAREPIRAAYYREALHHWVAGLPRGHGAAAEEAVLTPETCENLKSLGYIDQRCPK